ncbi:hypothetical protein E2P81_ATG10101 [Venturia nashicola]|uniref:Uncharacterized protein n=1 Tax=Venturia nashicola TaxID=86259 RepID=A0A4Z1NKT2_9PEZI|nr:hypothetical protein E6O75_ATG10322 [Venturia nashicola]TLD18279.1 hypothetical protein E2P81_ATG10101 [Venturia nashicola]
MDKEQPYIAMIRTNRSKSRLSSPHPSFLGLLQELKDKIYDITTIDLTLELFAKQNLNYKLTCPWSQFCLVSSAIRLANKQLRFKYSARIAYRCRFELVFGLLRKKGLRASTPIAEKTCVLNGY